MREVELEASGMFFISCNELDMSARTAAEPTRSKVKRENQTRADGCTFCVFDPFSVEFCGEGEFLFHNVHLSAELVHINELSLARQKTRLHVVPLVSWVGPEVPQRIVLQGAVPCKRFWKNNLFLGYTIRNKTKS